MKMDSCLIPLQSLGRPDPSRAPSSDRRCAQGNFSYAAVSPCTSKVFPKQKSHGKIASARSSSIPIPIRRIAKQATASEIKQAEEELLAEVRDCAMYTRIVNGMAKKASFIQDTKCREDVDLCLAHIVATRFVPKEELDECVSLSNDWALPCNEEQSTLHMGGSPPPVMCTCALGRLRKDDLHALIHRQDDDLSLEEMIFDMDI